LSHIDQIPEIVRHFVHTLLNLKFWCNGLH